MKYFPVLRTLISLFALSLLLSVALTSFIMPDEAEIIAESLSIAKNEGWINHPESAARLTEVYHARKHAIGGIEASPTSVFLTICFGCCVFLICCQQVVKMRD